MPDWNVRALRNHVVGAARMFTLINAGHAASPDAGDLLDGERDLWSPEHVRGAARRLADAVSDDAATDDGYDNALSEFVSAAAGDLGVERDDWRWGPNVRV